MEQVVADAAGAVSGINQPQREIDQPGRGEIDVLVQVAHQRVDVGRRAGAAKRGKCLVAVNRLVGHRLPL